MTPIKMGQIYTEWKNIYDSMYAGKTTTKESVNSIIKLLRSENIKLRPKNHKLKAASIFVYDKDKYADRTLDKPLGIGFIYEKPNGKNTQDIFVISQDNTLDKFYSETEMVKKYPALKGTHKDNLPI